jgi:predicted O-methyltransferase YrrM
MRLSAIHTALINTAFRILYSIPYVAQRSIEGVRADGSVTSQRVADGLLAAWRKRIDDDEKTRIGDIELSRCRLASSSRSIAIEDYGAGTKDPGIASRAPSQEKRITKTMEEACRTASGASFLIFKLVRSLKPSTCLELGTGVGISAAYTAAALDLNRTGRLVTIEGAQALAALARENFRHLGLARATVVEGRFENVLEKTLRAHAPFDFVFIDGHHEESATTGYFRGILPFLARSAVMVFDNIDWSKGMKRAWRAIANDGRIPVTVDAGNIGICVIDKGVRKKRAATVRLQ